MKILFYLINFLILSAVLTGCGKSKPQEYENISTIKPMALSGESSKALSHYYPVPEGLSKEVLKPVDLTPPNVIEDKAAEDKT